MKNKEEQNWEEFDLEIHGSQEKMTPAQERYIRKKTGEAIRMYYETGKLPLVQKSGKSMRSKKGKKTSKKKSA